LDYPIRLRNAVSKAARRASSGESGFSIADIVQDEQFKARGIFETVVIETGDTVKIPAVLLKLSDADLQRNQ